MSAMSQARTVGQKILHITTLRCKKKIFLTNEIKYKIFELIDLSTYIHSTGSDYVLYAYEVSGKWKMKIIICMPMFETYVEIVVTISWKSQT